MKTCYYPHYVGEKAQTERWNKLLKITVVELRWEPKSLSSGATVVSVVELGHVVGTISKACSVLVLAVVAFHGPLSS